MVSFAANKTHLSIYHCSKNLSLRKSENLLSFVDSFYSLEMEAESSRKVTFAKDSTSSNESYPSGFEALPTSPSDSIEETELQTLASDGTALLTEESPKTICQRIWRRCNDVGFQTIFLTLGLVTFLSWQIVLACISAWQLESRQDVFNYTAHASKVLSWMDQSVDPCEDFAQFAYGSMLSSIQLEGDQNSVNPVFQTASARVNSRIEAIIKEDWPYIGTFYRGCLDEARINARGDLPILSMMLQILTANSAKKLLQTAAQIRLDSGIDLNLFFRTEITKDVLEPDRNVVSLSCRAGTLDDRSYYYSGNTTLLDAYKSWLQNAFAAAKLRFDDNAFAKLLQLERRLYGHCSSTLSFNIRSQTQLNFSVGSDSFHYLLRLGVLNSSATKINLDIPAYYLQLQAILNSTDIVTLQNYALVSLFTQTFPLLGSPFQELTLSFLQIVTDIESLGSRHQYCVRSTERSLGMLLSHYYIQSYFDEEARNYTSLLMQQLIGAYQKVLAEDIWMDEHTLAEAQRKFDNLQVGVGSPADWPNLDALLQRSHSNKLTGNYFEDVLLLRRARDWSSLQHLGQSPVRDSWEMLPIDVNAYYSPENNRIAIPAGIISDPFFSLDGVPDAANYCMLGSVLGHELGHVIDSSGALFDADGRFINWWTPASKAEFEKRINCIEMQYSQFEVAPGVFLNGPMVSGEAMADLNGLSQALAALVMHRKADPDLTLIGDKSLEDSYGLTWKQLCFVSFAQMWATKARPSYEALLALEDPHPIARFRLEGTLRNMPAFAAAFECPVGSHYNPEEKCDLNK